MKIYLVGGAVRDKLMGLPVKERDWVVVGGTIQEMLAQGYRQVGKDFPVFLHPKTQEEYALARVERKVQPGYQGFTFDTSTQVSLEEDLERRDLTINAMAETADGELVDPFHGFDDLQHKILRHVSPAFAEDPVRILRVGRLLARFRHFGFQVAPETVALMREMVLAGEVDALVAERVWKEWDRALTEPDPGCFFEVLAACDALPKLFPELRMESVGMQAMNIAALTPADEADAPATAHGRYGIVRFAALLHDLPDSKKAIATLSDRYRVPNSFRNLALITARHYPTALGAQDLNAEEMVQFFSALDIYRREKRFENFLLACQAIAEAREIPFNPDYLREAARIAKSINVHALLAQGFTGIELAKALEKNRQEKIAEWLRLV